MVRSAMSAVPQSFGPCLLWPNGWMDQDVTWYGGTARCPLIGCLACSWRLTRRQNDVVPPTCLSTWTATSVVTHLDAGAAAAAAADVLTSAAAGLPRVLSSILAAVRKHCQSIYSGEAGNVHRTAAFRVQYSIITGRMHATVYTLCPRKNAPPKHV